MKHNQNNPRQDIIDSLAFYHPLGTTFEIRLKGVKKNKSSLWGNEWTAGNVSGFFNDLEAAADTIIQAEQDVQPDLIMTSINNCSDDCLARANNRFRVGCQPLKNIDIQHLSTVLIDFDPIRAPGISATDAEKAKAFDKAMEFAEHAKEGGLPKPIINDSGNGYHVSFKIPKIDTMEGEELIKRFTELVADNYSDEAVTVDNSVCAPAHQVRVIGTINRKGENMPERPHRRSTIISLPDTVQVIPKERLVAVAKEHNTTSTKDKNASASFTHTIVPSTNFDLGGYLGHYNITVTKTVPHGSSTLHVLEHCLFNVNHENGEAAIGQRDDGTLFYQCFHSSCKGHRWKDAKQIISGKESLHPFIEGGILTHEPLAGTVISMEELTTIHFPPTIPLIEGLVSVGGATVISGPGGVGKSNLTLNMALSLGSPGLKKFLDLDIKDQVNTLIVQAENAAADTKDRLMVMANEPGVKSGMKHVFSPTHNLSDIRILGGDFNDEKFLIKIQEDIVSTSAGLLIIDPLISFHRGDENDNSAMRRTLDRLTLLMSNTGIAIILIHHVGRGFNSKKSAYAGRGASAVGDWVHNSFLLEPNDPKTDTLELSCQKARNFKKPDSIFMRLNQNLVFERVYQQGNFNAVYNQRTVKNALHSLGGIAKTQKELIDAMITIDPNNINKTKAFDIIKDAVTGGAIIEGQKGRSKTYELPEISPQLLPESSLITP